MLETQLSRVGGALPSPDGLADSSLIARPRLKAPVRMCKGEPFSLRVSVVVLFVIVTVFFAAVLFVFFLVWFFPNEDSGSCPAIRRIWVAVI